MGALGGLLVVHRAGRVAPMNPGRGLLEGLAVAGLVAITPAAGVVGPMGALAIVPLLAVACIAGVGRTATDA